MGKIITIEGFWRIGKTSLCRKLDKRIEETKYIHEPDHLKLKSRPGNVEYWYLKKWKEKMELAKKYKEKGRIVIMERSFISTIAFNKALGKKTTRPMRKLIKYHEENVPDIMIILEAPSPFLKRIIFSKTDKKILKIRILYKEKKFFIKYTKYLGKSIDDFKVEHFYVKVANDNNFYPLSSIVDIVLKKLKEEAPLR